MVRWDVIQTADTYQFPLSRKPTSDLESPWLYTAQDYNNPDITIPLSLASQGA